MSRKSLGVGVGTMPRINQVGVLALIKNAVATRVIRPGIKDRMITAGRGFLRSTVHMLYAIRGRLSGIKNAPVPLTRGLATLDGAVELTSIPYSAAKKVMNACNKAKHAKQALVAAKEAEGAANIASTAVIGKVSKDIIEKASIEARVAAQEAVCKAIEIIFSYEKAIFSKVNEMNSMRKEDALAIRAAVAAKNRSALFESVRLAKEHADYAKQGYEEAAMLASIAREILYQRGANQTTTDVFVSNARMISSIEKGVNDIRKASDRAHALSRSAYLKLFSFDNTLARR